jgi:hypothetical protein
VASFLVIGSDVLTQRIAIITKSKQDISPRKAEKGIRTASYTNKMQARKAGAMRESEGLPSARMAKVM